ncbi:hypothetical protein ACFSTC_38125 [Nonomuraea ferruginea]
METTGLRPSWHDRIVEVGVVLLDPRGLVTGEWSTLVNPERDLGPQRIRGLTASRRPPRADLQGDRRESRRRSCGSSVGPNLWCAAAAPTRNWSSWASAGSAARCAPR